jgi:hypothetical protein
MSKRNSKHDGFLPKHQKKIVLCLAKNGAMTMSQTNKALKGENTSTTRAFHELEKKGFVTAVGTYERRGRRFSKYWLTDRGIGYALLNGANSESTKNNAMLFSKDRMIGCFFELRSVSPEMQNLLDRTMLQVSETRLADFAVQSLSAGFHMGRRELEKTVGIIRKSGECESVLKKLNVMRQSIETLEKMLIESNGEKARSQRYENNAF